MGWKTPSELERSRELYLISMPLKGPVGLEQLIKFFKSKISEAEALRDDKMRLFWKGLKDEAEKRLVIGK